MLNRLFSSKSRVQILGRILLHPEQSFHIRELERFVGAGSYNSVWRELKNLEAIGIVTSRQIGRTLQYQANPASALVPDLTELFRKNWAIGDLIAPAIRRAGEPRAAFVYGSFASGEFGPRSDIDIIIIGQVDSERLDESLSDAEVELRREISYRLFSETEWRTKVEQGDPFAKEVLAGPKVLIVGGADELEEVGRQG